MITYDTLYKRDSTGRLRFWRMQLNGSRYRTVSGLEGGTPVESGWTQARAASKPTDQAQALFEVQAKYEHQLAREYHSSIDTVDTPKMIEPMLAKSYNSWPGPGFFQPKLDGIRCIMTAAGMFTRQGQPITAVPHLHAAAAPLFAEDPDLILDGELYNHDFREDFGEISSIVRKKNPSAAQLELAESLMQYHVYDIVDPTMTFAERYARLDTMFAEGAGWLRLVPTRLCRTEAEADEHYGTAVSDGYEGGMYRLDTPYEIGRRSKNLLKRKDFITREYRLKEWVEGNGNWAGAAKRATLWNDDASEFGAGVRGKKADLIQRLMEPIGPHAEVTLRFFQLSPDGVPRFPVVIDYHPEGRVD